MAATVFLINILLVIWCCLSVVFLVCFILDNRRNEERFASERRYREARENREREYHEAQMKHFR